MSIAAFRSGDFCSKGGEKDQGDFSLWLRRTFQFGIHNVVVMVALAGVGEGSL